MSNNTLTYIMKYAVYNKKIIYFIYHFKLINGFYNINKIKCNKLEKYINKYKKSLKIVKKYVKLILIRVYEYYINII